MKTKETIEKEVVSLLKSKNDIGNMDAKQIKSHESKIRRDLKFIRLCKSILN